MYVLALYLFSRLQNIFVNAIFTQTYQNEIYDLSEPRG